MKKILRLLVILVPIVVFVSCSDRSLDSDDLQVELALLEQQFAPVSQAHNAGLATILRDLQEMEELNSRSDLYDLMNRSGRNFLRKYYKNDKEQSIALTSHGNALKSFRNISNSVSATNLATHQISRSRDLNKIQKKYINEINEVLTQNISLSFVRKELKKIRLHAMQSFEDKKKVRPIVVASLVGEASYRYWNNNLNKWNTAIHAHLDNDDILPPVASDTADTGNPGGGGSAGAGGGDSSGFDPGLVAAADASAAVAGAAWSWVTGCAELTLGACMAAGFIGAGVISSATTAGVLIYQESQE